MKHTIKETCIYFAIVAFILAVLFFGSRFFYSTGSVQAIDDQTRLINELQEEKDTWSKYAPEARQGRIAERHMTLANQKANLIRQELSNKGFTEGQN